MRKAGIIVVALLLGTAAAPAFAAPQASATPSATRAKTRRPAAGELAAIVRTAITTSGAKLPKGSTVTGVQTSSTVDIPVAPSRVTIDLTPPPRRAGRVSASAVLVFWKDADIAGRVPVTLDLSVPPEALLFDVAKGASLTLVIRRGLVEVTTPAVAAADADVGDVVQVLLRPSGRALRAQLVGRERAIAVEDGR